ncbi:hypothetical protein C8A00DRAFT_36453 [Chaetomidium leptoderma]|uniref:DUF7053 domain-containing protein n=1 Tax=Chaetomidium leptoderma TaxID=669021 RepID=A0AAN6VGZ4_9PEZI|nr:hypothetical protein C8A00DRAFT_36453 [Chaetomidium leptoderma]
MTKRTAFTTITPLPAGVTRKIVLDFLHDHEEMIDLNPLVKERHPIPTPPHASPDEQQCQWYSLTDKISYLPGVAGDVTYTCAFNDLPTGIQTHCYAPAGLTIRNKWSVGGSVPGELSPPIELGVSAPPAGLYLREDIDMRCNVIMTSFVKKTLKKSHAALVDRLKIKAEIASINSHNRSNRNSGSSVVSPEPNRVPATESSAPSSIGSISSSHYSHLSSSAPTSRPSSAASSVASAASSVSNYSVQSSPMWSPAPSSLGTSPALSAMSPPAAYNHSSHQYKLGEYVAQPRQQFVTPQPAAATIPVPVPETPFLRQQQPAAVPEQATIPVPVPETPFLRQQQPDWLLRTSAPLPPPQQQQPDWPLKIQRPAPPQRPQSHLFIQAYRPPPGRYIPPAEAPPRSNNNPIITVSGARLSDDALWQALGGGPILAAAAAGARSGRVVSGGKSHVRAQSQQHQLSHPDYPQMSPYHCYGDDNENDSSGVGVVGLGVVSRGRPVSMPSPARSPLVATMNGPFVADLK